MCERKQAEVGDTFVPLDCLEEASLDDPATANNRQGKNGMKSGV